MLAARRMMPVQPTVPFVPVWLTASAGNNTGVGGGTSISSASAFTPPANTLILVTAAWFANVASTTTGISDTIGGLTWTEITAGWHAQTIFGSTEALKTSVFWAVTGSSPPSGSITVTAGTAVDMHFEVIKVPSAKIASPIGTTGLGHLIGSFGGSQTLTVTTAGTPAASSCMIAAFGEGIFNTSVQPTDDASFINLFWAQGSGTSRANLDASYNLAGANSTIWTMPASSSQFWNYDGILVEIVKA